MAPSIAPFSLLISSSLLLAFISLPNGVAASASLVQLACSDTVNIPHDLCLYLLDSYPKISSAKNLLDFAVAIINTGIANATATEHHLRGLKGVPDQCSDFYYQVVSRFRGALLDMEVKEYMLASYGLVTASTDYVKLCDEALAKQNFPADEIIRRANLVLPVFGLSADVIVQELEREAKSSPPPSSGY